MSDLPGDKAIVKAWLAGIAACRADKPRTVPREYTSYGVMWLRGWDAGRKKKKSHDDEKDHP